MQIGVLSGAWHMHCEASVRQTASLFPEPLEPGTRWLDVGWLWLGAALAPDAVADGGSSDRARSKVRAELNRALHHGQSRFANVLDVRIELGLTHCGGRHRGLGYQLLLPW